MTKPGTVIPMVRCEHNPELMAAINGLRDEYERAHQSALDWKATWEQTQDKLTIANTTRRNLHHLLYETRRVLRVIQTAVRGDEHSQCHDIRAWLDEHDIYNGDISGPARLVEMAIAAVLAQGEAPNGQA